jgi:DnaJ-class molecular chaperone
MGKDYYSLLGVVKDADDDKLKSAYRKMAMRWHPDKNKGSKEAEAKFKEVGGLALRVGTFHVTVCSI